VRKMLELLRKMGSDCSNIKTGEYSKIKYIFHHNPTRVQAAPRIYLAKPNPA